MNTRRDFVKLIAAAGMCGPVGVRAACPAGGLPTLAGDSRADRPYWIDLVRRIATPVLEGGAVRRLAQTLRGPEILGAPACLLAGIAPWLESEAPVPAEEEALRQRYRELARQTISSLVDPRSPDYGDFAAGETALAGAAFLADAILRAPGQLWQRLAPGSRSDALAAFGQTRRHSPAFNHQLLFAAIVEAFFARSGAPWDAVRVDCALRQFEQWYRGDGFYSDGAEFRFDYSNSLVIHPMLLDVLAAVCALDPPRAASCLWGELDYPARMLTRAQRSAVVHERLISPEGALPRFGGLPAYRSGLLHGLAQLALLEKLPRDLPPAQVRSALTAVMRRLLDAPGTFDEDNWLRGPWRDMPPALADAGAAGSLYLCTAVFLPLGLTPENAFWTEPEAPWSARQVYGGDAA